MIARYNHFARSDYSKSVKLKYCCLAFCQCYRGSDERGKRKFDHEEHARCCSNIFQKKDMKFLPIELYQPIKF